MFPLIGKRNKCKECPNFDYCEKCLENNKETHKHEFEIIPVQNKHALLRNKFHKMRKLEKNLEKCKTMGNIFEKEKEELKLETEPNTNKNNLAEKLIHFGITCDGCNKFPIVGCRYKCSVCDDFDFCEECEKKLGEKHNHPFLKIYEPKMTPLALKCFGKKE